MFISETVNFDEMKRDSFFRNNTKFDKKFENI